MWGGVTPRQDAISATLRLLNVETREVRTPFQSIEEGNHRAFWTHTAEDQQGNCVDVCDDNLDNDCVGFPAASFAVSFFL